VGATIHIFVAGLFQTNTFVVASGGACWVVDPAAGCDDAVAFVRRSSLAPAAVLLTHAHGDHISGVSAVRTAFAKLSPPPVLICPAGDEFMLSDARANMSAAFGLAVTAPRADRLVRAGQTLTLDGSIWTVLDTSGHTPGGVSYYCAADGVVIVGDTLFAGGIGRTDFPGADSDVLAANIRANLLTLPDETRVLPGHGGETTIGVEKRSNPFL
jgi:glyoxylase-like metal-dependent hydrolase (beta-lactamase superfamily II)